MTHHQRCRGVPLAAFDMKIGVADARGGDLHADFAGFGPGKFYIGVLDGGGVLVPKDDGFHSDSSWLTT